MGGGEIHLPSFNFVLGLGENEATHVHEKARQ